MATLFDCMGGGGGVAVGDQTPTAYFHVVCYSSRGLSKYLLQDSVGNNY